MHKHLQYLPMSGQDNLAELQDTLAELLDNLAELQDNLAAEPVNSSDS